MIDLEARQRVFLEADDEVIFKVIDEDAVEVSVTREAKPLYFSCSEESVTIRGNRGAIGSIINLLAKSFDLNYCHLFTSPGESEIYYKLIPLMKS